MYESQKRVLIVDDEEDLTWTLQKKLSKDKDVFEVICVNSGREAIDVLHQLPVNLVITDVRMPEVSGLDLLTEIKRLYPDTRVIIMTAYGSSDVQKAANERGCFHYIEKPFEINALRQLILDALEERKGFKGSVSDFQLSDIIQLNCLGRLTSALKVTSEEEEGYIYFHEGNIVHAETERLQGEAAFYHIMSWQSGEFTVMRNQTAVKQTIKRGWQSLLLESLRRIDESSDLAKQEAAREKRKRYRRLQQILGKIFHSDGVEYVFVHNRVGFPLFYLGEDSQQKETITNLGNQVSGMLERVMKNSRFLMGEELHFWEMQFQKKVFILQKIPNQDAYLTIVGNQNVNSGYIRLEIKKNLDDLSKLL